MNKRQLSQRAANRFSLLMRNQTQRIQQSPQQWRRNGVAQASANQLIFNDKVLVMTLMRLYQGNLGQVQGSLRQFSGMAAQHTHQVLAQSQTLNQLQPLGTRPPTPEEIALNMQNGVPDLMFTQAINMQAAVIETENEEVEMDEEEANQLLALALTSPELQPHQEQEFTPDNDHVESKANDHPAREALEEEAAVEALMKLAQPGTGEEVAKQVLEEVERFANKARTATPKFTPPVGA